MSVPPNRHIETYRRGLQRIVQRFDGQIAAARFASPAELLAAFDAYWQEDEVQALVDAVQSRMVTALSVENARTWRDAARKSTRGAWLHQHLRQELTGPMAASLQSFLDANARLIASIPAGVRERTATVIATDTHAGRRMEDIARDLQQQFPDLSRGRIAVIARTESSKAWTALTRARAEDLSLAWYVWRTSKDARVRAAHRHMDGVLVRWDDPPSPEALHHEPHAPGAYAAGDIWNCRCYPEPLLDLQQVRFPARVSTAGQIVRWTQAAFVHHAGGSMARAA